jgi:hypothetical protein
MVKRQRYKKQQHLFCTMATLSYDLATKINNIRFGDVSRSNIHITLGFDIGWNLSLHPGASLSKQLEEILAGNVGRNEFENAYQTTGVARLYDLLGKHMNSSMLTNAEMAEMNENAQATYDMGFNIAEQAIREAELQDFEKGDDMRLILNIAKKSGQKDWEERIGKRIVQRFRGLITDYIRLERGPFGYLLEIARQYAPEEAPYLQQHIK